MELAEKILKQESIILLDVRSKEAHTDWNIKGSSVKTVNIPYFDLLDDVTPALEQLPKNEAVYVICAKEPSSIMVAEALAEEGVNAIYVENGMRGWSEVLLPIKVADLSKEGELIQFVRPGKGCLSYMVVQGEEAIVIDASRFTDVYKRIAKEKGVTIKHVMDTHLHADHLSGGRVLAEATGGTYYLPPKDAGEVTYDYEPVEEGDVLELNGVKVEALYSPGHTIGSTSFIVDETYLLTGDILFIESIGRPDLAGMAEDWVGDLSDTLYRKYKSLPGTLEVLPAHFSSLTEQNTDGTVREQLGNLYKMNAGLQVENEDDFRKMVTENLPSHPNDYERIRQTNMGKENPSQDEKTDMETGPNNCAVS
nr:MBL fold metallo-hydrolase [Geomicrobium sediminis]